MNKNTEAYMVISRSELEALLEKLKTESRTGGTAASTIILRGVVNQVEEKVLFSYHVANCP